MVNVTTVDGSVSINLLKFQCFFCCCWNTFSLKDLINNGLAQPQAAPKRGQLDVGDLLQDLDGQNPPPLFCTVMGECTSAQVTAGSPLLQVHALQPICHLLLPGQTGSLRCNPSKPKPGQWIFCIGFPFTLNVAMEQNDSTSCFVFLGNFLFI